MLTRIEIDGFKTFDKFSLDLGPFVAIVGPNASGKSNLFDAIKFLSLLAQTDVRTAMLELRGEPEELFRRTRMHRFEKMTFAVEVIVERSGADPFGTEFNTTAQRLRYEVSIAVKKSEKDDIRGIFVESEKCFALAKRSERATFISENYNFKYNSQLKPFIDMEHIGRSNSPTAFRIRQDGPNKRGRPIRLPAIEASRTALSTVTTAEFPHLYALRDLLSSVHFLELNPQAARKPSDRFEERALKPDASNLSAVLARLREETRSDVHPEGMLANVSADLAALIPSVKSVRVKADNQGREYSFELLLNDLQEFSSRVISDGTLRLLALLAVLNDPMRKGVLCFEEPENGVHEGRIRLLVELLREATSRVIDPHTQSLFQVLVNTHSPALMMSLEDEEIVVADMVNVIDPEKQEKSTRSRMRTGIKDEMDLFDPETNLTRFEIGKLLRRAVDAA